MEEICIYIDEIKRVTSELYSEIFHVTGEEMLKRGGCFEFVKVMKNRFDNSKIYIRFDASHSAIWIDGTLYDASGIVRDVENYHKASLEEVCYLQNEFGKDYKALYMSEHILEALSNHYKMR